MERTRCSHAETMNNGYITEAEVGNASPEDVSLIPTVIKNGFIIAKGPDISGDKKVKIECIISKRIQTNDFQPLGTVSSRARTGYNTINYKETTSGLPSIHQVS